MTRLDEIRKELDKEERTFSYSENMLYEVLALAEAYRLSAVRASDWGTGDEEPYEKKFERVDAEAKRIVEERKNV